jgi:nucleotidyltransferase/DNA polymerase involved in DNA repair
MAKLCSGMNKPNSQTLLPAVRVPHLLRDMPLSKVRGLGGQLGQHVQDALGITTAGASLPYGLHNLMFFVISATLFRIDSSCNRHVNIQCALLWCVISLRACCCRW